MEKSTNPQTPLILLTQSQESQNTIKQKIQAYGWQSLSFPTLFIQPHLKLNTIKIAHLIQADIILFISPNAARSSISIIKPYLEQQQLIAMGPATAEIIQNENLNVAYPDTETYDSNQLLTLHMMQNLHEKKVLIICGNHHKNNLSHQLKALGAIPKKLTAYKACTPNWAQAKGINQYQQTPIDWIITHSPKGLESLHQIATTQQAKWLYQHKLIVASPRMATLAATCKFQHVFQAKSAYHEDILSLIQEH